MTRVGAPYPVRTSWMLPIRVFLFHRNDEGTKMASKHSNKSNSFLNLTIIDEKFNIIFGDATVMAARELEMQSIAYNPG